MEECRIQKGLVNNGLLIYCIFHKVLRVDRTIGHILAKRGRWLNEELVVSRSDRGSGLQINMTSAVSDKGVSQLYKFNFPIHQDLMGAK